MGFFGFGEKPEMGQGEGRNAEAMYRKEDVSPIDGTDPSQPIEFTPSDGEATTLPSSESVTPAAIGNEGIAPEDVDRARAHLFGDNVMPYGGAALPSFASVGAPKSSETAGDGGGASIAPGSQGNGDNHISYSPPEAKADGEGNSQEEPEMPSVLGGF